MSLRQACPVLYVQDIDLRSDEHQSNMDVEHGHIRESAHLVIVLLLDVSHRKIQKVFYVDWATGWLDQLLHPPASGQI